MASRVIEIVSKENRQATYDLLTSATLNDNPEVSGEVSQRIVTARLGAGQPVNDASQIGLDLATTNDTELITRLGGEEHRKEQEQAWEKVWETFIKVIDVLFSDPTLESDGFLSITGNLCEDFDKAVECLIPKNSENKSMPELVETFLRCVLLAVSLVNHYKQNQTIGTRKEVLARVVITTGYLLIRIGVRYRIYSWVTRNGWQGVRQAVHGYIMGQRSNSLGSNVDFHAHNSRSIRLRWQPSRNAIFLVGGVLVITFAYYRYHYS